MMQADASHCHPSVDTSYLTRAKSDGDRFCSRRRQSNLLGNTSLLRLSRRSESVSQKVGDTLHPSLERIIALRPAGGAVSTASQLEVFTQQLQNQNIAVFVTDPHDLEGVFRSIRSGRTKFSVSLNKRTRSCRSFANGPTPSRQR